jgi:hypothetical protein
VTTGNTDGDGVGHGEGILLEEMFKKTLAPETVAACESRGPELHAWSACW